MKRIEIASIVILTLSESEPTEKELALAIINTEQYLNSLLGMKTKNGQKVYFRFHFNNTKIISNEVIKRSLHKKEKSLLLQHARRASCKNDCSVCIKKGLIFALQHSHRCNKEWKNTFKI